MPVEQTGGTGLKVFHGHTNDTPPSTADLVTSTAEKVDIIGVISGNGDTWVVEINCGDRPTESELRTFAEEIRKELEDNLVNYPETKGMTPEEINYMLIREKFLVGPDTKLHKGNGVKFD